MTSIFDNWFIPGEINGLRFHVTVDTDVRRTPFDKEGNPEECYTPENIAAWEADLWEFVFVTVTPEYDGVPVPDCAEALGGVHCGFMESGGDRIGREDLAEYPVRELISQSMCQLHNSDGVRSEMDAYRATAAQASAKAITLMQLSAKLRAAQGVNHG